MGIWHNRVDKPIMPAKKKKSSGIFDLIKAEFDAPDYGLKQFRRDVAKLRKLGLVSKKTNSRKQNPTRYMRNVVRQFADVLTGKAAVLTVPKFEKEYYKKTGHKVKGQKAVIPTPHGEKVRRTKPVEGTPTYTTIQHTKTGQTIKRKHVLLPAEEFASRLKAHVQKLPALKKGEYYAFRYRGYMSLQYFGGKDAKKKLLEYLMRYINGDIDDVEEELSHFEIVTIEDGRQWAAGVKEQRAASEVNRRQRNKERYAEWRARKIARGEEIRRAEAKPKSVQAKKNDAEYQKKKRASLKETNPQEYQRRLNASKARMAKTRRNRKS